MICLPWTGYRGKKPILKFQATSISARKGGPETPKPTLSRPKNLGNYYEKSRNHHERFLDKTTTPFHQGKTFIKRSQEKTNKNRYFGTIPPWPDGTWNKSKFKMSQLQQKHSGDKNKKGPLYRKHDERCVTKRLPGRNKDTLASV